MKLNIENKSRRLKLFLVFFVLLGVSFVIGMFAYQFNELSQIQENQANTCEGGVMNEEGCGMNGGCCDYGARTGNPNFVGLGHPLCNPENCVKSSTRMSNVCGYTHYDVCIQRGVAESGFTGGLACTQMCYWGCCSNDPNTENNDRYLELPGGELIKDDDYYNCEDDMCLDGRLEEVSCTKIKGWMGSKRDHMLQTKFFITIGKPYGQDGAIVFNPDMIADATRGRKDSGGDGEIVCDFLDNKPDGILGDCEICKGTACDHGFEIDLTKFKDSAIFNNQSGNRIFLYGIDGQQYGAVPANFKDPADGQDKIAQYLTIPDNCGAGWDGKSDELPPLDDGGENGGENGCDKSADMNVDQEINLQDFNLFANFYRKCQTDTSATECRSADLNCDNKVSIADFTEFVRQYNEYYEQN